MIHCGNQIVSNTKITSMERKVRTFTFLELGTLANFTIFRNLLTIFDYLSLALGYVLQNLANWASFHHFRWFS